MAAYHATYQTDLAAASRVIPLPHIFAMGDNESHTFTALVFDSRDPHCGLMDGTVAGVAVRPDGATVPLMGVKGSATVDVTLPDGTTAQATPCSVTMIQGCFAYPGQITIVIRLVNGEAQTAVLVARGTVTQSLTDTVVDPGEVVPDIATLLAAVEACEEATEAAENAALYAAELRDSDATGVDLDISDPSGNVLARFSGGHIATKNFDSSKGRFSGKKWVCIGDSLTAVNAKTTMHYHDYIADETGITVVNLGYSGRGYATVAGGTNFSGVVGDIPEDADVITIFGSGNDMASGKQLGEITDTGTDTVCGCINTALSAIYSAFMTTPIGIITPTPWKGNEPSNTMGNPMFQPYVEALVQIAARRGIPCLDLYHCSLLHPSDADFRDAAYSKDIEDGVNIGVHPDETGHALITPRIREFVASLI